MALLQPKITGDPIVDSWASAVTRALNAGTIGASGAGTGDGGPGRPGTNGFNTATIYLFRRHTSGSTPPTDISSTTTYTYSTGILVDPEGDTGDPENADDAIDGYFRAIPDIDVQDGQYIWVISVNIADQGDVENIDGDTWSAVTLLAGPQEVVNLVIDAREQTDENDPANWNPPSFLGTNRASPNFKNDSAAVKGLVATVYIDGVAQLLNSFYDGATFTWQKNGMDFTPEQMQVDGVTGIDQRVLLINEKDVDEDNANEIFTCSVDYVQ